MFSQSPTLTMPSRSPTITMFSQSPTLTMSANKKHHRLFQLHQADETVDNERLCAMEPSLGL